MQKNVIVAGCFIVSGVRLLEAQGLQLLPSHDNEGLAHNTALQRLNLI